MQPNRSFSRVRATKARKIHGFVAVELPKTRKKRAPEASGEPFSSPKFKKLVKYVVLRLPGLKTTVPESPNPRKRRGFRASEPPKPRIGCVLGPKNAAKPMFFEESSLKST